MAQVTRTFQKLAGLLGLRGSVPRFTIEESEPIQFVIPITELVETTTDGDTITNSSGTMGVASANILGANPRRKYAIIVNDSDTTIYISLGATAASNSGIRLNASGGSYEITTLNPYTGVISGIAGVAGKVVTFVEITSP